MDVACTSFEIWQHLLRGFYQNWYILHAYYSLLQKTQQIDNNCPQIVKFVITALERQHFVLCKISFNVLATYDKDTTEADWCHIDNIKWYNHYMWWPSWSYKFMWQSPDNDNFHIMLSVCHQSASVWYILWYDITPR